MDHSDAITRFYALVWPHAETVLRVARYLIRDPAEADDVAQETLVKAFKALQGFESGTDMRAWLMRILRNTRIDHFRAAAAASGNVSLDELGANLPARSNSGADQETAWVHPQEILEYFADHNIIEALHELPEKIRWTLLLVDVEGLDHEDAAKVLSVPVGTVKSRAFRGRAMLRKALLPVAKNLRLVR